MWNGAHRQRWRGTSVRSPLEAAKVPLTSLPAKVCSLVESSKRQISRGILLSTTPRASRGRCMRTLSTARRFAADIDHLERKRKKISTSLARHLMEKAERYQLQTDTEDTVNASNSVRCAGSSGTEDPPNRRCQQGANDAVGNQMIPSTRAPESSRIATRLLSASLWRSALVDWRSTMTRLDIISSMIMCKSIAFILDAHQRHNISTRIGSIYRMGKRADIIFRNLAEALEASAHSTEKFLVEKFHEETVSLASRVSKWTRELSKGLCHINVEQVEDRKFKRQQDKILWAIGTALQRSLQSVHSLHSSPCLLLPLFRQALHLDEQQEAEGKSSNTDTSDVCAELLDDNVQCDLEESNAFHLGSSDQACKLHHLLPQHTASPHPYAVGHCQSTTSHASFRSTHSEEETTLRRNALRPSLLSQKRRIQTRSRLKTRRQAAVCIQSMYRRFRVRRVWPAEKSKRTMKRFSHIVAAILPLQVRQWYKESLHNSREQLRSSPDPLVMLRREERYVRFELERRLMAFHHLYLRVQAETCADANDAAHCSQDELVLTRILQDSMQLADEVRDHMLHEELLRPGCRTEKNATNISLEQTLLRLGSTKPHCSLPNRWQKAVRLFLRRKQKLVSLVRSIWSSIEVQTIQVPKNVKF